MSGMKMARCGARGITKLLLRLGNGCIGIKTEKTGAKFTWKVACAPAGMTMGKRAKREKCGTEKRRENGWNGMHQERKRKNIIM